MHIHFQIRLYAAPVPDSEECNKIYGQKVVVATCHSTNFSFKTKNCNVSSLTYSLF